MTRNGLIAGGCALGLFAAAGGVFLIVNGRTRPASADRVDLVTSGVSPNREGETWTHRELLAHLKTRGLKLDTMPASARTVDSSDGPAVWVGPGRLTNWHRSVLASDSDPWVTMQVYHWSAVIIQKCPSADTARDRGGVTANAFSWGRFLFMGEPKLLNAIAAAMEGRPVPDIKSNGDEGPMKDLMKLPTPKAKAPKQRP